VRERQTPTSPSSIHTFDLDFNEGELMEQILVERIISFAHRSHPDGARLLYCTS
jgi:hypothetical protein